MDIKRKVGQVFKENPQASRVRGRPKKRWLNWVLYKQILIMQNYTLEREFKKQLTGRKSIKEEKVRIGP